MALGFTASGGLDRAPFRTIALVVLPIVLFLGIATFVRIVQVQRELVVYTTGMNRIRHFFVERAPACRPYLVLPIYDDELSLSRSIGTGMRRRPPRRQLPYLVVQTQGIVGVVTGAVAAALGALVFLPVSSLVSWIVALLAFVATVTTLFTYWLRSLRELRAAIIPLHSTPADEADAPF